MISYNHFTLLLKKLLLDPLFLIPQQYNPGFSTKIEDFVFNDRGDRLSNEIFGNDFNGHMFWCHEEPLNLKDLHDFEYRVLRNPMPAPECKEWHDIHMPAIHNLFFEVNFHVFANSEISPLKKAWLNSFTSNKLYDWYFFFHGFAALDWYRDYKYLQNPHNHKPNKVFICLNHLIQNNRSYRLTLLSHLQDVKDCGIISAPTLTNDIVKEEITDPNSRLSVDAKKLIASTLLGTAEPMVLDEINYNAASSSIIDQVYQAVWFIVTETIYYDEKLHLTEKIFKPIVTKKPFILVGAAHNLAYLKRYGFKTFDQWIDESYDKVTNPDLRMKLIVREINKLCQMPWDQLLQMQNEMQEVLDYNYQHFFGAFKEILVDELLDNFQACTTMYNANLSERFRLPIDRIDYNHVKQVLLN